MNIRLFLQIIRARYLLILLILAMSVVTAVIVTNLLPKKYVAMTSLVLNGPNSTPFDNSGVPSAKSSASYMATQLDIIRSKNVALKVVDALHMDNDSALQQKFQQDAGGQGDIRDWLADNGGTSLTVQPSQDSQVININYESTDPQLAANTANAYAQAYIATTLELMMEPARRNAEWFDDQLKVMRKRLAEAQARLTSFQQEKGIISVDERLDTETNRLNELTKSYVAAQSDTDDIRSRQLGENHPEYKRAITRESALRRSLDEQKNLILELKKQRDQLNVLARDVDNEQRIYDTTLQNFNQTTLESQFNQPSIAILNQAVPPRQASSPIMLFNIVSSVFLGLLLGIIFSIGIELFDRRVRTIEDVDEVLEMKVLAVV